MSTICSNEKGETMFTLRFTNVVVCSSDGEKFADIESAYQAGRNAGFEFSVWEGEHIRVSWTVFGGRRNW